MIILTDCLTEKQDEGCIKVASQLTARIKKQLPDTTVLSFRNKTEKSDIHLKLNRFFLNSSLRTLLREKKEPVLYIPFASNTTASVLRTLVLSRYTRGRTNVLFTLQHPMGKMARWLLRKSGAKVVTLSEASDEFYRGNGNQTLYIKTGVDTKRFVPVSEDIKRKLREKHHIPQDTTVVLHVGHLNSGRNVQTLLLLPDGCYGILVCSSRSAQDADLRKQLESSPNILIVDTFVGAIEEWYQLSDLYLFPVLEAEHCIDVPLSVLEAASCNLPVITTPYGELKALQNAAGFCFISDCAEKTLSDAVAKMNEAERGKSRETVMAYDWDQAIGTLAREIE